MRKVTSREAAASLPSFQLDKAEAHLAGKQDMLAGLGHGAVRSVHDKDPAVHLHHRS